MVLSSAAWAAAVISGSARPEHAAGPQATGRAGLRAKMGEVPPMHACSQLYCICISAFLIWLLVVPKIPKSQQRPASLALAHCPFVPIYTLIENDAVSWRSERPGACAKRTNRRFGCLRSPSIAPVGPEAPAGLHIVHVDVILQAVVTKKGTVAGKGTVKPAQKKTLRERAGWWSEEKNAAKLSQWYGPDRAQFLGKWVCRAVRH